MTVRHRGPSSRPPVQRMQWLDEQLRRDAFPTAAQAVARFEVSRRTFYRDVDYMRLMLGAPIAYDRGRRGYRYTDKTFSLAAVTLSEGELLALLVAEHLLKQYEGTPFGPSLAHAVEKIAGSLNEPVTVDLSGRTSSMLFDLGPIRPPNVEVFNTVAASLRERRALCIRYYTQSRCVETERLVEPYHLHNHKGDWYLIAFCHQRGEVRSFLMARIRQASPTDRRYAIPESFDIDAYIHQGFGIEKGGPLLNASIWFDPHEAPWIRERRWHPTQRIAEHPDGSLTLHIRAKGLTELARWVLSYGEHAIVLRPEGLRRQVKGALALALRHYGGGKERRQESSD